MHPSVKYASVKGLLYNASVYLQYTAISERPQELDTGQTVWVCLRPPALENLLTADC